MLFANFKQTRIPQSGCPVREEIAGKECEEYRQDAQRHELGLTFGVTCEVSGGETRTVHQIEPGGGG